MACWFGLAVALSLGTHPLPVARGFGGPRLLLLSVRVTLDHSSHMINTIQVEEELAAAQSRASNEDSS